mmetsp:Transcript_39278/g.55252  ORF Transcript_39278/g.55252 Transcript_39278/m.55252 type:complete len:90 (+) Transcript_39278:746-1015(+)
MKTLMTQLKSWWDGKVRIQESCYKIMRTSVVEMVVEIALDLIPNFALMGVELVQWRRTFSDLLSSLRKFIHHYYVEVPYPRIFLAWLVR